MSKRKMRRVKLCYENWKAMRKDPKNSKKKIMCYFMGFWTAFTDHQVVEFIGLCSKKDRKLMMTYPLWQ